MMKFAYPILLFVSGSLALEQDNFNNVDDVILTHMPTQSIAQCPQVHWRPLTPYKSILFPEPWWFLPDADQANKDHYDVTHPSLPSNIILPSPLLPTNNETIKELYTIAVKTYEEDMIKQVRSSQQSAVYYSHIDNVAGENEQWRLRQMGEGPK